VLSLPEEARKRLSEHHSGVLARLQEQFDIDTTDSERQMSWGMRIASTLGALALAVAAYFFFYRFWGVISTPIQVLILVAAPCLAVAGMERVSRRERTLYLTGLIGVVAFSCFVLNISVLGTIFNITPSQKAFIPWGAFALILAYSYRLRMMLAAGLLSLMAYLTATVGTWSGAYWIYIGQRPENYILAGVAAFVVPFVIPHPQRDTFPAVYRLLGMLATFIAILVLANWGEISYLKLDRDAVEILYQMVGFLLAGLSIWFGIRRGMKEVVNTGATFFVILLYTKFFDWWWDWMPKYLFFLVLGLIAVGLLFILSRARRMLKGATS
jgi:uncharacterized membrane protein